MAYLGTLCYDVGMKTYTPQKPTSSEPTQPQDAPWSPAMALSGLFLVFGFYIAGPNDGLVMALGGALSIAALFRGVAEKQKGAIWIATFAVLACIVVIALGRFSKG